MEIRCIWKEKGPLCIGNFLVHKPRAPTPHTHSETDRHNIRKEETEEKAIEYHQTKTTYRNTREKKQGERCQKTKDKMTKGNLRISVIALLITELNTPIKRQRVTEWIIT